MKYIYESPDGGKTIYRYPLGNPDKRELYNPGPVVTVTDDGVVIIGERHEVH